MGIVYFYNIAYLLFYPSLIILLYIMFFLLVHLIYIDIKGLFVKYLQFTLLLNIDYIDIKNIKFFGAEKLVLENSLNHLKHSNIKGMIY